MPVLDEATALRINRRTCLSGFGLGSVALAQLLAEGTTAAASQKAVPEPHHKSRAKNVILLFMVGGVSQLESFDHKPLLTKHAGRNATDLFSTEELDGLNPE